MQMTDIVERLRFRADENYEMLGNIHEPLLEAAAEIERLRAGGCARDQGTTQYCAEAAKLAAENEKLREWNAEIALNAREFVAENEKLRAALERLACTCDRVGNAECSSGEVDCPFWQARAALEEGRT